MFRVFYAKKLPKLVKSLPKEQKEKLSLLVTLLGQNPDDNRLHTKPLKRDMKGLYSFRISREWRVIFRYFKDNSIEIMEVEHRKDVYR